MTTTLKFEEGNAIAPSGSIYPYEIMAVSFKVYRPNSRIEVAGLGYLQTNSPGMATWRVMVAGGNWMELPNAGGWKSAMSRLVERLETQPCRL